MASDVLDVIWSGLKDSFLMAWEVWWALVLGFAISAIVQAWVPRERIESALSGSGPKPVGWATGLGAASSSCSYAAIAIAKSLFQKGASAASALAFQSPRPTSSGSWASSCGSCSAGSSRWPSTSAGSS